MPVAKIFVSIKEFLQNNSKTKKNEQCVTPDVHQESKHIHIYRVFHDFRA
jgi:hypothetical protein